MRVIDFMPPRGEEPDLVRIVEGVEGSVPIRMELVIRFDYGSIVPWVRRADDDMRIAIAGPDALALRTPIRFGARTSARSRSSPSRRASATRSCSPGFRRIRPDAARPIDPEQSLDETCTFWREWLGICTLRRSLAGAGHPVADRR